MYEQSQSGSREATAFWYEQGRIKTSRIAFGKRVERFEERRTSFVEGKEFVDGAEEGKRRERRIEVAIGDDQDRQISCLLGTTYCSGQQVPSRWSAWYSVEALR